MSLRHGISHGDSILTEEADIFSVTQLGRRLRILVPKQVDNAYRLVERALRTVSLAAEIEMVAPNLEDVFVAATQKR